MSGGMTLGALVALVLCIVALKVYSLVQANRLDAMEKSRGPGTAPGQGHGVNFFNMSSNGRGRDHLVVQRHTRDPQAHARAMMPRSARKSDDA